MHIAFSPAVEGGEKALINVDVGMNHLDGLETPRLRAQPVRLQRLRSHGQTALLTSLCCGQRRSLYAGAGHFRRSQMPCATARAPISPSSCYPELIRHVTRLDSSEIVTEAFTPGYFSPGRDFLRRPIPNADRIRDRVQEIVAGLGQSTATTIDSDQPEVECDGG